MAPFLLCEAFVGLTLLSLLLVISSAVVAAWTPSPSTAARRAPIDHNRHTITPRLVFPGGGIFFYWQAGVVEYLRTQKEEFSLAKFSLLGASAGSLTATLTACDVDFHDATDLALRLCEQDKVWDRGLQGVWGPMIENWLEELLPEDIDQYGIDVGSEVPSMQGHPRLSLLLTPIDASFVQSGGTSKRFVNHFENKRAVVETCMASVHLPWFLDGKLTRRTNGAHVIDGSFRAGKVWEEAALHPSTMVLSHNLDPEYKGKRLSDIVEVVEPTRIWDMLRDGKKFGQFLHETGQLNRISTL